MGVALVIGLAILEFGVLFFLSRKGTHREVRHFLVLLLAVKILLMATVGKEVYMALIGGSYDGLVFDAIGREMEASAGSLPELVRGNMFTIGQSGSGNVSKFIAFIYRLTGPSFTAAHMIFAAMGVWAIYLAYRAVRIAFPEMPWRRYVYLLALLPSIFVFSSLVLKDAPALAALCLFLYGVAWFFRRSPSKGMVIVAISILIMVMIRPYMAFFMSASFGAGVLVQLWKVRLDVLTPIWRGAIIGSVVLALFTGVSVASGLYAPVGDGIIQTLGSWKATVARQKAENPEGSGLHIEGRPITKVSDLVYLPRDVVSVYFRPFIWEVYNFNSLLAGAENLLLLFIAARLIYGFRSVLKLHGVDPVLVVMLIMVLLFGLGYALVAGNLGTAFRLKGMTYPFFLGLYAVAEWSLAVIRSQSGYRSTLRPSLVGENR